MFKVLLLVSTFQASTQAILTKTLEGRYITLTKGKTDWGIKSTAQN